MLFGSGLEHPSAGTAVAGGIAVEAAATSRSEPPLDAVAGAIRTNRRWAQSLPAVAGLLLFFAALEVLRIELRTLSWPELMRAVLHVPRPKLTAALVLTALNYLVLTGYDLLAFAYIGRWLPVARVMLTGFLAYAIANNISFAMLSGAWVRYRFYARWGVTTPELSRIVFSYSVTFWLGLLALGGLSLLVMPLAPSGQLPARQVAILAGSLLMLIPVSYLAMSALRKAPLRLWRLEFRLPSPRLATAQLGISVADWALAAPCCTCCSRRVQSRFFRSRVLFSSRLCSASPATFREGSASSKGCWCCC